MSCPTERVQNSVPLRRVMAMTQGSTSARNNSIPGPGRSARRIARSRRMRLSPASAPSITKGPIGPLTSTAAASATQNPSAAPRLRAGRWPVPPGSQARASTNMPAAIVASCTASVLASRDSAPSMKLDPRIIAARNAPGPGSTSRAVAQVKPTATSAPSKETSR